MGGPPDDDFQPRLPVESDLLALDTDPLGPALTDDETAVRRALAASDAPRKRVKVDPFACGAFPVEVSPGAGHPEDMFSRALGRRLVRGAEVWDVMRVGEAGDYLVSPEVKFVRIKRGEGRTTVVEVGLEVRVLNFAGGVLEQCIRAESHVELAEGSQVPLLTEAVDDALAEVLALFAAHAYGLEP